MHAYRPPSLEHSLVVSPGEPAIAAPARPHSLQPWIQAVIALIFGYTVMAFAPHELSDEGFHAPQVWNYFSNNNELIPALTVPPTYHFILGKLLRQVDHYSVGLVRLLSMLIASLSLLALFAAPRHYHGDLAGTRMLQALLMPLAFPFYFLVYTDIWTLGAIVGMVALCLRERHGQAALLALLAMALRPTAVVWLGYAIVLGMLSPMVALRWQDQLRKLWPYLIPVAAFAAFFAWNGGIAIGDRSAHQLGINLTNLYMFLLCGWFVLLPWHLMAAQRIWPLLQRPAILAALIAGFFAYMGSYSVTHGYNDPGMSAWLHNIVLAWLSQHPTLRALCYLPIAWTVLTLATTRLPERRLYFIYPVIVASVVLHPLIEPRYYLPGLTLLILLRPPQDWRLEAALLLMYVPASAILLYLTASTRYFL